MSEIVDLLSELSDLDSAPKTPDAEPVIARPEPVATGYEPKTQFGRYVDSRQKTRAAREASMSDVDKEMRANRIAQVANIFASPLVKGLTSVISRGRVVPDMDMRNEAATQKQLADRMSVLENNKAKTARAADYSAAAEGLTMPEGYESMQPVVRAMAKNDPEQFVGLVTRLAGANRTRGGDYTMPLSEDERAELSGATASEKAYAESDPAAWRKSKMSATYAGERYDRSMNQRQYEQSVQEANAKRTLAQSLAGEWRQNPANVARLSVGGIYKQAETVYKKILEDPTYAATGDQVLITALNKLVDPNSVVREAEYNRTGADLPLFTRWESTIRRLATGGRIEPNARATLMDIMRQMDERMRENAQIERDNIAYRASQYGVDPKMVLGDVKPMKIKRDYHTTHEAEADAPNLSPGTEIYINGKLMGVAE